ncbi:MAG: linear amide C-N hydrolase [bacterium]|nr:linear amide C-N hydrolase [bacterium]
MDLHYFIHDRTGASAIVEYLNGKLKIINNPRIDVITNTPYTEALKKINTYKGFGGSKTIPGGPESIQRFVRAAYYLKHIPKNILSNYSLTNAAVQVINECVQPPVNNIKLPDGKIFKSITYWSIISNLTTSKIFYKTLTGPNYREININKINFFQ